MAKTKITNKFTPIHYRHLTNTIDIIPVIPPPSARNPFNRDWHREIAYALDYTGDNDDVPTFLFSGNLYNLLKDVFSQLLGKGEWAFQGFRLYRTIAPKARNGKSSWRTVVELKGYRPDFLSLDELAVIIEFKIRHLCWCNIRKLKLNKFLNI